MIQQGVSVGGESIDGVDGGMTIGRVMDWIDARLEAIKSREEEEEDEEERDSKSKHAASSMKASAGSSGGVNDARDKAKANEQQVRSITGQRHV